MAEGEELKVIPQASVEAMIAIEMEFRSGCIKRGLTVMQVVGLLRVLTLAYEMEAQDHVRLTMEAQGKVVGGEGK